MNEAQAEAAMLSGLVAGYLMFFVFFALVLWVLLIIARWKMFTKAGEAGWKSIIPIYADYICFKLYWDVRNFLILLGVSCLTFVFSFASGGFAVNSNGDVVFYGGNAVFTVLTWVATIVAFVWSVRLSLKTAAAYGKGIGFGIGLILLPNIFTLILGFGSARYVGPQVDGFAGSFSGRGA